jgi:hypothetical protein
MANEDPNRDDPYARGSFSMRPAARWQVWAMTVAGVVVVVALLAYAVA